MGLAMRVIQRLFQRIAASEDLQVGTYYSPAKFKLTAVVSMPSGSMSWASSEQWKWEYFQLPKLFPQQIAVIRCVPL